jgi:hypothetical protein
LTFVDQVLKKNQVEIPTGIDSFEKQPFQNLKKFAFHNLVRAGFTANDAFVAKSQLLFLSLW